MKPDWDKLMEEFKDSPAALIADVDCTAEGGEELCQEHGIQGYPSLKYGDPADLQDYEGGRDFESLQEFAKENLKPMCSPMNIDLCDDEKKAQIKKFEDMIADGSLAKAIEVEEKKLEDADAVFEAEVEKLQERYEKLSKDNEDTIAAVKAAGLSLMKSVMKASEKTSASDEL